MSYGFGTRVQAPFADVLAQVRQALADNGFGVITEIDLAKTLHDKIGADVPDQVILGACSPHTPTGRFRPNRVSVCSCLAT